MTVQMYDCDQQNVDPTDNSTVPSNDEQMDVRCDENKMEEQPNNSQFETACTNVCNETNDSSQTTYFEQKEVNNCVKVNSEDNFDKQTNFIQINNGEFTSFPECILNNVEDIINKPRWAINVIPCKEFETLLDCSIKMIKNGKDEKDKLCRHFLSVTMTQFFTKFYSDDIIDSIKVEVFKRLIELSFKMVEAAVLILPKDNLKILDFLFILFCPSNRFSYAMYNEKSKENYVYAKESDNRISKGLIIDLINHFGHLGGFDLLLNRLKMNEKMSLLLIFSYIKPFNSCFNLLTQKTIQQYFIPILKIVPEFIENISDENFKKEVKLEGKSDIISSILRILKNFALSVPDHNEIVISIELLKLKILIRLLQISSFNGKMNALNELNKIITTFLNESHTCPSLNDYLLSSENMAHWLVENNVLEISLKDCLHQPQYVEKLENIIRFLIKENALSFDYLDKIWNAQLGKHEIIVKNVHDLIAKLALSFSSDQLNHFFQCFQCSWSSANKKEREKLLELMRRLAEDDKDGSMAHQVLTLLWNIAYSDEIDIDIIDQALNAHLKILGSYRTYAKDSQKIFWLEKCIAVLEKPECSNWVLLSMKHIREICMLFPEAPMNQLNDQDYSKTKCLKPKCKITYRHELILNLQNKYEFVALISQNLSSYMQKMQQLYNSDQSIDPNVIYEGKRFSHFQEVQERLNFLKFFLQDGQLWLCLKQANDIWNCLAQNAVFYTDRQTCFCWFTSLMANESDLDPDIFYQFFEMNILKLDPTLVDFNGIECFEKFFNAVNCQQQKLIFCNNNYFMEDNDLVGLDYLWKLILFSEEKAAFNAINILIELYTNLGPKFMNAQMDLHHDLINTCFDRLKASYDTISIIENDPNESRVKVELVKMTRVLTVLHEYVNKCDTDFSHERTILPMSRSFRGKQVSMFIKILNFGRNEELEFTSHTNESLNSICNRILTSLKLSGKVNIEFLQSGEKIDLNSVKFISQISTGGKLDLSVRLSHSNTNISCCPESIEHSSFKRNPSPNDEDCLPGVIMSKKPDYANFLFSMADLGMSMSYFPLRKKCLDLLRLIPPDEASVNFVKSLCYNKVSQENSLEQIENQLFLSPTKTVYFLGIIYSLLLPANNFLSLESQNFQLSFINRKWGFRLLHYLDNKMFLSNADKFGKVCAILMLLKISKVVLSTISFLKRFLLDSSFNLNEALQVVPNDFVIRKVSMNAAQNIYKQYQTDSENLLAELDYSPNMNIITSVLTFAWATSTGNYEYLDSDGTSLHQYFLSKNYQNQIPVNAIFDTFEVCKEAMEVCTLMIMLSSNELMEIINNEKWKNFIIDLLLLCTDVSIRNTVMEQFTLIFTKCLQNTQILNNFISLQFDYLKTYMSTFFANSRQFFQLFCNLLDFAYQNNINITILNDLLEHELNLLKNSKDYFVINAQLEDIQLEGHLKITKQLVLLLDSDSKYYIGCNENNRLVDLLLDEYIFTASKSLCNFQTNNTEIEEIDPICSTSNTLVAAYDLLVALCTGCVGNLQHVSEVLQTYLNNFSVQSWDYFPNMGTKPINGFVGLKNAGATCYMNSVLQQLFMIPEVREGILSVDTGSNYNFPDNSNEELFLNQNLDNHLDEDKKSYDVGILKQIQIIFGHLLLSKCQYYVPKGFWQQFKMFGGPINLREQQDALEFFNSLFDSLDEALKVLGKSSIMSNIFGGTFADQKICKGCPHRYSMEESFTTLNVDVRNHNSLVDSLEQYVKGDLLEGDNAYYCEKCDRKVETVKRLCIKKLPKILAIQLKRFDYDYERETPIKFNDYFEFPRVLDMRPYTVDGLAAIEGENIEEDSSAKQNDMFTQYELNGIVVHSGQASGGHYFSFILDHSNDGKKVWYKFDDGDVSECKLSDDEEMKNQCFGGDYVAEVCDQVLKMMILRTEKRWWNAFILIYRNINKKPEKSFQTTLSMPIQIKRNIQHQNVIFMHRRNQFSEEFYYFMKSLFQCNIKTLNVASFDSQSNKLIIYTTLSLLTKFLFFYCFRTKKSLRGSAIEWYEVLIPYLKTSLNVRMWFMDKFIVNNSNIFCEFLLECPASDVRHAFSKLIVFLSHYSLLEQNLPPKDNVSYTPISFANRIIKILLHLLHKEVAEYNRQSAQYFNLFYLYATLGYEERKHLLIFDVASRFMLVSTDQGPGPPIRSPYVEFGKLFQVVSLLIRCCDISEKTTTCYNNKSSLPNPYKYEDHNDYIMPIQPQAYEILFVKKNYLKKIIKDAITLEDTSKLILFCCWENPSFSLNAVQEILWHITYSYTFELKPYFHLLNQILLINDSWHEHRIRIAFYGEEHNYDGLFHLMQHRSNHLEKRAYQCIQLLVSLFNTSKKALFILKESQELKHKWLNTVFWLKEELNKKYSSMLYMQYNNWSSSNDQENNYSSEISINVQATLKQAESMLTDEDLQCDNEIQILDDNDHDSNNCEDTLPHDISNIVISNDNDTHIVNNPK